MKELLGVHHVALSVPDMAVARRFYIDLLGAEEVSGGEWEPGNAFIDEIVGLEGSSGAQLLVRLANTYVEIFEYRTPRAPDQDPRPPVNRFGYTHIGLQVDDIDAVYARMVDAGLGFHCAPRHSGGDEADDGGKIGFRSTYGRDFFGNVFELIEINRGSAIAPLGA